MNTKSLLEMEADLKAFLAARGLEMDRGIRGEHIDLEDGLPWLEISGEIEGKSAAEDIAQDLASALDVKVLFNRLESWGGESRSQLHLVLDIDAQKAVEDPKAPAPANLLDPDAAEFMEDYGEPFLPRAPSKGMRP